MATLLHTSPKFGTVDPGVPLADLEDFEIRGWKTNDVIEARIVHEIEGRFNASYTESRMLRMHDWRANWEFASGNQWIEWNAEIPDFVSLPIPEELRYTENQFRGTMRQGVNLMVQGDPAHDVLPRNTDWDSREAAKLAKAYLFAKGREFNLGRLRVQNIQDSILYGFGVRKTYWQTHGGAVDARYLPSIDEQGQETDEPLLNKRTREPRIAPGTLRWLGQMCQDAISPWSWFPQPGRDGPYMEGMEFCEDVTWVSPAWVTRAFKWVTLTAADFEKTYTMPYQLMQPGDLNWTILGSTPSRKPPQGKIMVITHYEKPSPVPGFERGLEIRICGSHVLDISPLQTCPDNPPFDAPLPFTTFVSESRRGTFYPRPPASDWREPQMRINQSLSDTYTWTDICTRPNLLSTKGDDTPDVVSFGFEHWKLRPGATDPRWLICPPIPAQIFELKAQAERALDRVSMLFGATRGERSSSDPSGYYLDVLREHDQIDLQASVRDQARAEEQAADHVLRIGKNFERPEMMLEIVGNNGKPQLIQWQKDRMRPDKVRVEVQSTSLMPFLASSRRRAGLEAYEKGALGFPPGQMPPPQARKFVQWLDIPDLFHTLDLGEPAEFLSERVCSWIIDEQKIPIPPQPENAPAPPGAMHEGEPVPDVHTLIDKLVKGGKAFLMDADWDPNELLQMALDRKMQDDEPFWPDRSRELFGTYIEALKQLQTAHAQSEQQAALAQQEAVLALQAKYNKQDQEDQASARAKTHMVDAAAQALLTPTPGHAASETAKAEIVKGFAQHLFKWTLAEESGGRSGEPGGREAHGSEE